MVSIAVAALLVAGGCASGGSEPSSTEGGKDGAATSPEPLATTTTAAATAAPHPDQAPPATINGIALDGSSLWVASIEADEVLQVDLDGTILQRFDTAGAGPDDVAVAPDGTVYSTGFTNGDVGVIRDGAYEVLTTIAPGINPVEVTDEGEIYVGTFGPDGTLFRVPDDGGDAEEVATGLPDINAFGALPDGRLLAPSGGIAGPGGAIAIDPATGRFATVAEGLPPVAAATTTADGTGWLLANISGEIYRVDPGADGAVLETTVDEGKPFDNLAVADDGTIYLSSFVAPTITVVGADGDVSEIRVGDG